MKTMNATALREYRDKEHEKSYLEQLLSET